MLCQGEVGHRSDSSSVLQESACIGLCNGSQSAPCHLLLILSPRSTKSLGLYPLCTWEASPPTPDPTLCSRIEVKVFFPTVGNRKSREKIPDLQSLVSGSHRLAAGLTRGVGAPPSPGYQECLLGSSSLLHFVCVFKPCSVRLLRPFCLSP